MPNLSFKPTAKRRGGLICRFSLKIYVKGNKPFYLRIVYKDAQGNLLQLLPNPYRTDNYFNGGTMYEIPSGADEFELEVSPPFGMEKVMVYASTTQLGNINLTNAESVYQVNETEKNVGIKTRGVNLKKKPGKVERMRSRIFLRR